MIVISNEIVLAVGRLLFGFLRRKGSDRRHLLSGVVLLRTVRATFTAYGSSLHKGVLRYPPTFLWLILQCTSEALILSAQ